MNFVLEDPLYQKIVQAIWHKYVVENGENPEIHKNKLGLSEEELMKILENV